MLIYKTTFDAIRTLPLCHSVPNIESRHSTRGKQQTSFHLAHSIQSPIHTWKAGRWKDWKMNEMDDESRLLLPPFCMLLRIQTCRYMIVENERV